MSFDEARIALTARHKAACDLVHALATESPTTTDNEWRELVDARKLEHECAADLMRLNRVEADVRTALSIQRQAQS